MTRVFLGCAAALLLLAACSRGPGEDVLRREVQEQLTRQVKPGLLELASLHRRGSSPLPAAGGTRRIIVYYNATLRLLEDYDFGGWETLSPASLAYAMGATVKGMFGIKPQNRAGDLVHVYGSASYEWSGVGWTRVAAVPSDVTAVSVIGNTAPPSRSKTLVDALDAMVDRPPPGVDPTEDKIISEELGRAEESIRRRLDRRKHIYTFASGPRGGEYARFGTAILDTMKKAGVTVTLRNFETEGSVQNAWLLFRGDADYALIQSDVAAHAVAGDDQFARGGPLATLRALGSLFPEPVHIVVAAGSSIHDITDLHGKRVDIGLPSSGTQYDAVAVLEAYGLRANDLGEVKQGGFAAALAHLRAGTLDALFITTGAPNRRLQELSARNEIRVLPLRHSSIEHLVAQHPGLVRIVLPVNTYPGQAEAIPTVAAAALLVTTNDAPDTEVERVLACVFTQLDFQAAGSAEGSKVSRRTALQGITIPMHQGASRYFGSAAAPPTGAGP